jgi:hypothetical protein
VRAAAALLPLAALTACADAFSGAAAFRLAERDSAGVRIVEMNDPDAASLPTWQLAETAVLAIGSGGRGAAYELFRVRSAIRLHDGGIAIASAGSFDIRVYDAAGRHVRTIGRQGFGPGEFQSIGWIGEAGADTIVAYDTRMRRLSWFADRGVGRTLTLQGAGRGFAEPEPLGMAGASFLAMTGFDRMFGSGERRDTITLYVFDDAGALADSLNTYAGPERFFHRQDGFAFTFEPIFGRTAVAHSEGGRTVVASTDDFAFDVYDGRTLYARVRADRAPAPADAAAAARRRAGIATRGAPPGFDMARIAALVPMRPTLPAFDDVRVDRTGDVWVRDYPLDEAPQRWTIFADGVRPVARVVLPAGVSLLQVGKDYVLALHRDELGIESVLLLELDRMPPP